MGGASSQLLEEKQVDESTELSYSRSVMTNVAKKVMFADGVRLEKSKLLEVMFPEGEVDSCSSRGRALMLNCVDNLIGPKGSDCLSIQDYENFCNLILTGHDESAGGAARRVQLDRKFVQLLLLENAGKPSPEIVEDIMLLAYSASMYPPPIISGVEEDFASKLAVAMVDTCDSTEALLTSWERASLPIAYECRRYFANRLRLAATDPAIDTLAAEEATKPHSFSTPIGSFGLWILSEILPPTYSPPKIPTSQRMPSFTQWQLLFDSNKDGLSFSRLETHAFDYKSPTLILFGFNQNVFVVAIDCEWRRGVLKWGGPDCSLLHLLPKFHFIESKPGMILCNTKDRSIPKGMQFGSSTPHVEIDDGLLQAKFYGIGSRLDWIQVIGCGPATSFSEQMEYRKLTDGDARRLKDKKLHVDDWGVDSRILDWGGVSRGNLAKNYGVAGEKSEFVHIEGTAANPPSK